MFVSTGVRRLTSDLPARDTPASPKVESQISFCVGRNLDSVYLSVQLEPR
jgi:hypothetical protein